MGKGLIPSRCHPDSHTLDKDWDHHTGLGYTEKWHITAFELEFRKNTSLTIFLGASQQRNTWLSFLKYSIISVHIPSFNIIVAGFLRKITILVCPNDCVKWWTCEHLGRNRKKLFLFSIFAHFTEILKETCRLELYKLIWWKWDIHEWF